MISGESRGALACLARGGLQLLSPCYGLAVALRNAAFDCGLKRPHRVSVPVISVGNITTGGTGKTPFVAFLADWFQRRNKRVCLLSRGYRSLPGEANDEKLVLNAVCPGVPHVQNPDRVAGAHFAIKQHKAEVILLDDGFQHRRLSRDLDIVLIDALNPWGYDHLLPRGLLREPLRGLRRAGLIVITRADAVSAAGMQSIVDRLQSICSKSGRVAAAFPAAGLLNASGQSIAWDGVDRRNPAAFCGIGNPAGFRQTLLANGCEVRDENFRTFPDHHHYTPAELEHLGERARQSRASCLLTTLKDLVKINRDELDGVPLWAVKIGTRILEGEDLLGAALQRVLSGMGGE